MNDLQVVLADKIIQYHHDNEGMLTWDELHYLEDFFPEDWSDRKRSDQLRLVKGVLLEHDLITLLTEEETLSALTSKGSKYKSYVEYKSIELEKEKYDILNLEKLQLEIADLKSRIADYEKNKKQNSLALLYSAISTIIALGSLIISLFR